MLVRILKPTLAIATATRLACSIPAGAIIDVLSLPPDGNRLVDVVWMGAPYMMFIRDLKSRGEEIKADLA